MKKKIVLLSAVLLIAIASAFAINGNLFSNQQAEALQFLVTVYQYGGGSTQSNAEIEVVDSNNGWILSGTTDSNGVYSCLWPGSFGNFTVRAWYPARPNDGQSGQTGFSFTGSSVYTSVTLGPNY
ncbi:MAG: hypothetical protein IPM38_06875 [Ignavibacteria bacterium]|nr:hypothetical protein [Ignavibacteria bacterium]MBK9333024.1 hypothetical protein [Ignavibacteria bacterium]